MLDYLPSLVAFAAAVVALSGAKKTDPAKRGLGRLMRNGWIAIVLAVLALGASAAITRRSHDALAAQVRQQQALRSIAHAELRLSLHTITQWFFSLLGDDGPEARYQLVPPHVFDKERIYAAQSVDIREPLTLFSPPTT